MCVYSTAAAYAYFPLPALTRQPTSRSDVAIGTWGCRKALAGLGWLAGFVLLNLLLAARCRGKEVRVDGRAARDGGWTGIAGSRVKK